MYISPSQYTHDVLQYADCNARIAGLVPTLFDLST